MAKFAKRYITQGQRVPNVLPYSEVCMHMRVAGEVLEVELVGSAYPMAQLYKDGQRYSAPITTGEAGIYRDYDGRYYISEEVA
jgi:hypothetical protein